jgi:Rrf2 family protein
MIKFSRSEDYAIILVNKLAREYDNKLVPLSEIAKEYAISVFFLRNLANTLRSAGIIQAEEGKTGGYMLTKAPQEIKMGEILNLFSHNHEMSCCSDDSEHKRVCPQQKNCIAGNTWRKLNKEFVDKVYNLSLIEFMNYHG